LSALRAGIPSRVSPSAFVNFSKRATSSWIPGEIGRELLENGTLDLGWILPHLRPTHRDSVADRRTSLQDMLRAGYLAEQLPSSAPAELDEDDLPDMPF
jgi:hypothetical protein